MSSSSIYYKFKSQKDFSRITFDGSTIGLALFDVKREIILAEKLGTGADFDLKIFNADSNQEYADDAESIPRSTSIIVQRKPPSRGPGKGSASRYVNGNNAQISSRQEFKKTVPGPPRQDPAASYQLPPPPSVGGSEDDAIRAMLAASSNQWQETQERMASARPVYRPGAKGATAPVPDRPPPQGYVCYRCGLKGHWIQACPTNGDESFDGRPRVKRTTGIPRSMLQKVEKPVADAESNAAVMVNAEGEYVMAVPDSASWETYQKNTQSSRADDAPRDPSLACNICSKLMKVPSITPCCKTHYCEECIHGALLDSDFVCPGCGARDILLDAITKDAEIGLKIEASLESRSSGGSSSGSPQPESRLAVSGQSPVSSSTKRSYNDLEQEERIGQTSFHQSVPSVPVPAFVAPLPNMPFDPMMMNPMMFNQMMMMNGMMGMPGMPPMPPSPMPSRPFPVTSYNPLAAGQNPYGVFPNQQVLVGDQESPYMRTPLNERNQNKAKRMRPSDYRVL